MKDKETYGSPQCEVMEFNSQTIVCASTDPQFPNNGGWDSLDGDGNELIF